MTACFPPFPRVGCELDVLWGASRLCGAPETAFPLVPRLPFHQFSGLLRSSKRSLPTLPHVDGQRPRASPFPERDIGPPFFEREDRGHLFPLPSRIGRVSLCGSVRRTTCRRRGVVTFPAWPRTTARSRVFSPCLPIPARPREEERDTLNGEY